MSKIQNDKKTNNVSGELNKISNRDDKQKKNKGSQENSKSGFDVREKSENMEEEKYLESQVQDDIVIEEEKKEAKVQEEQKGEEKLETKEEESDSEEQVVLTKKEADALRKKAEECDSFVDKLLRTRAEFLNYQKRVRKEHETITQFAIQDLISDLFPEFDNFERAVKLAEDSKDINKFVEGIKLIEGQLHKVLEKHGVKRIETVGKSFDPNLHEAVVEEENNELPHHTVIEELQRGFLLKERVVRPSKVKVSKRTEKERTPEKESDNVDDKNSVS